MAKRLLIVQPDTQYLEELVYSFDSAIFCFTLKYCRYEK